MTNPPMNWGYARTGEGFFHLLSRGQFDSFQPTADFGTFGRQFASYFADQAVNIGVFYFVAAVIPFLFFQKMPAVMKRWLLGIFWMWILVVAQTVAALNVEPHAMREVQSLFGPANALLMILAGIGLMASASVTKPRYSAPARDANGVAA